MKILYKLLEYFHDCIIQNVHVTHGGLEVALLTRYSQMHPFILELTRGSAL